MIQLSMGGDEAFPEARTVDRQRARVSQMIEKVEAAWADFHGAYDGLPDDALLIPGVCGDWSVRDLIAHVTWWDEEAITHLPIVLEGGTPPRYSVTYGGIDAFNAMKTEEKRGLTLDEVRREAVETHGRCWPACATSRWTSWQATAASPIASGSTPTGTTRSTPPTSGDGARIAHSDARQLT